MAVLPEIDGGYKFCPKCKKIYPTTHFSKDKNRKDGYCFYCKSCVSKMKKKYYKQNKRWKKIKIEITKI